MIGYIKSHLDKKRKAVHEKELKAALAKKFENFDDTFAETGDDETDYTIIEIGGQFLSVAKEQITIFDVDAPPLKV